VDANQIVLIIGRFYVLLATNRSISQIKFTIATFKRISKNGQIIFRKKKEKIHSGTIRMPELQNAFVFEVLS
jgi:hypothetical protein